MKCKTCYYYKIIQSVGSNRFGSCLLNPPTVVVISVTDYNQGIVNKVEEVQSHSPMVYDSNKCSHWKLK